MLRVFRQRTSMSNMSEPWLRMLAASLPKTAGPAGCMCTMFGMLEQEHKRKYTTMQTAGPAFAE